MAEIRVQEKQGPGMWAWVIGAIVLLLIVLAVITMTRGDDRQVETWEATPPPATEPVTQPPVGEPRATPPVGAEPGAPGAPVTDPGVEPTPPPGP
jgi:hypothetical protein